MQVMDGAGGRIYRPGSTLAYKTCIIGDLNLKDLNNISALGVRNSQLKKVTFVYRNHL